uniref:Capsid protein n=1 Tax=Torque teno sus virus k2 (isolate Pig/New Zealand/38E05/2007) TaxID=1239832 RepID=A0A2H4NFS4_TTVK2|nr:ORF1 [Torque teno sus virus k2b]AXE73126.1 ORF1 [Torque teno sus virus k2b]
MPPFRRRRWRWRRYPRYGRRRLRPRRYRRSYRRGRKVRRRRRYKRRRRTARIIQWHPPTRRFCTIKGIWPLLYGHWMRNALPMRKHNGLIWLGGGIDVTVWTLYNLYMEHNNLRNTWSSSNEGMEFGRFLRATLYFQRHPTKDYIITWDQDITCALKREEMQPFISLLKKNHKLILSRDHCNPKNKARAVKLKFKPPPRMTSKWFLQRELAQMPLFRLTVTWIDLTSYWVEGRGNAFYSTLGYPPNFKEGNNSGGNTNRSDHFRCRYFWIYDRGPGNAVYVARTQNRTKLPQDGTGNFWLSNNNDDWHLISKDQPYWLFFFGKSEKDLKKQAFGQDVDENEDIYVLCIIWWAAEWWNEKDPALATLQGYNQYDYVKPRPVEFGGPAQNLFKDRLWLSSQNYPPLQNNGNEYQWSARVLCCMRDNFKLTNLNLDDESSMLALFGPMMLKRNIQLSDNTGSNVIADEDAKDGNLLLMYKFKFQWGGHGEERFETAIGDPKTIPCPDIFNPGTGTFRTWVRNPLEVHKGILQPWEYDYDGLVRTDTLRRMLQYSTEEDETREKAAPFRGLGRGKGPFSDTSDGSDTSSSESFDYCEEEKEDQAAEEARQEHQLRLLNKRRKLKQLFRFLKRIKTCR